MLFRSVRVLDFGGLRSGATLGGIAYQAQEQFSGKSTHATDMYALGVLLFELLTGVLPGASANDPERKPPGQALAAQWAWLESTSEPLFELLEDLLSSDPAKRPDGKDCAKILERVAGHLPGEGLESWAAREVAVEEQGTDPLVGTTLVEKEKEIGRAHV